MKYGIANKNKIVPWGITVLIAALVSLFVLSAPANAGVSPSVGRNVSDNGTVIIGETNIRFVDHDGNLIRSGILESTWGDSNINIPFNTPFDTTSEEVKSKLTKGKYKVVGDNNKIIHVYFESPVLRVKTEVNGEDFSWVTRGGNITFEAVTNLWVIAGPLPNTISYKLIDPLGRRLYEVNGISMLNIEENKPLTIDTSDLDTGSYKLSIETDPATNNGLDAEGPSITFEVRSSGVSIEATHVVQAVFENIKFNVSTMPYTNVTLEVTHGIASNVQFSPVEHYTTNLSEDKHKVYGTSDDEGIFKVNAEFYDTGTYEITATELFGNTRASVKVKIKPIAAKLTEPDEKWYPIGKELNIAGKTYGGKSVVIKASGEFIGNVPLNPLTGDQKSKYNKEFSLKKSPGKKWNTSGLAPGKYKIKIWVLPASDPDKDPPDDSSIVYLLRSGLSVKVSSGFVAQGDDFKISGEAKGRDRVDILIIAPRGGSGHGLNYTQIFDETGGKLDVPGVAHIIRDVDDTNWKFETDDITVPKDADTGMYMIVVLNYGRDRIWGTKTGTSDLIQAISYNYTSDLRIKTQEQILELIIDKTVNQPGSDDLMAVARIKVENPYLRLRDIEDVPLGSEFTVRGITNRKEGTTVAITVEGPVKLKPQFVGVEGDTENNKFNNFEASFSTKGARIGTYIVTADDGDGHQATKTVKIVAPPANVTPPPGIELTPTPAAMPLNQTAVTNRTAAGGKGNVNVSLAAALQNHGVITAVCIAAVLAAAVSGVAVTAVRRKKKVPPYKRKVLHTLPPPPGEKWRRWFKR